MILEISESRLDLSRNIAAPIELRFSPEAGVVTGYAATFGGKPDSYGDVIAPGAFAASLAAHKAARTSPLMLWSHNPDEVIGHWSELSEDAKGLLVAGKLNLDTQRGRETRALLAAGDVSGLSIGFRTVDYSAGTAGQPRRTLKAVDLVEISVVALPANAAARVAGVKSIESKAELVDLLRGAGLAKAAAQKIAAGGWPALQSEDDSEVAALLSKIATATSQLQTAKGSR